MPRRCVALDVCSGAHGRGTATFLWLTFLDCPTVSKLKVDGIMMLVVGMLLGWKPSRGRLK